MDYDLPEIKFNAGFLQKIMQSNVLLYCVVLLLVLKIATVFVSVSFPQNVFFADITRSTLENSVNQTRQSIGLKALAENTKLNQAAQAKAENMVQNNYFDHTSPSGVTPWFWFLQAGYNYKYAGENLAIGFFDSKEVYQAWLNSPEHKANIVNPNYTEFGTAVLNGFGQNNTIVVVQEFASPLPAKSIVVNNNSKPAAKIIKPAPIADTQTKTQTQTPSQTQTQTINTNEKVLSQETEAPIIKSPDANIVNNFASRIINSVLYDYDRLLQNIIYGISLVVIGILITLIFFSFDITFKKRLVLRAVLVIVLLSASTLLNREIIISLIPHQIII